MTGFAMFACMALALPGALRAQSPQPDEFHVGDRIALVVEGLERPISDTVVVRDGLVLQLAGLGDISLAGVKRADVQKYLTQQIGKFIRDPIVHATPLIRFSVLGEVGKPGFYTMPSDVLLSDVVMRAGGPTGNADLARTVVKRGGEEVISRQEVSNALSAGLTLDQLHVAPGDEMVVGEKPRSGFDTAVRVLGVAIPLLTLAVYLHSR
jgi:polysaccharide export outer membrane protein